MQKRTPVDRSLRPVSSAFETSHGTHDIRVKKGPIFNQQLHHLSTISADYAAYPSSFCRLNSQSLKNISSQHQTFSLHPRQCQEYSLALV